MQENELPIVHIHADKDLKPETAEALGNLIKATLKAVQEGTLPTEQGTTPSTEQDIIAAVTDFVYHRHDLTRVNVMGLDEETLDKLKVEDGCLAFRVGDVKIKEKTEDEGTIIYYVSATLYFLTDTKGQEIEGSTDIYQCYRCGDQWCIEWYAS